MKKINKLKLNLKRESIRQLSGMVGIVGGIDDTSIQGCPTVRITCNILQCTNTYGISDCVCTAQCPQGTFTCG